MAGPSAEVVIAKLSRKLGDAEARHSMLEAYVEQLEGDLRVAQHRNEEVAGQADTASADS